MRSQFVHSSRAAAIAADARARVIRSFWLLLPLLAAAVILASAANAATGSQRRVALVMGNSSYQYAPHLPNPTNDAEAMAATLQKLGFEVTKGIDLNRAETKMIIQEFSKSLSGADVALLFYAGHGIQYQGNNYLIPVDAQLNDEMDLSFEAAQLKVIVDMMEREPRVNLVFLDACRDNPFADLLARSMGSTRSTSTGRGLAVMDAPAGSFVVYATDPDKVAADGDGSHSPFTAALLAHIETPGLSISDMMIEVRNDVLSATQYKQRPHEDNTLTSKFYFVPQQAVATTEMLTSAPAGNVVATPAVDKEVVFWQSIQNSSNQNDYQAYLDQYPNGTFTGLARSRIAELKAKPAETPRSGEQVVTLTPPQTDVPPAEEVERSLGLTRQGRSKVQLALTLLGYKTGGTDGSFGPKSRGAISAWQVDHGETATGYLTAKQHAALLDAAAPQLAAWDAEQKRKAAQLAKQQAEAEAAKQQQYQYQQQNTGSGTTTRTTQQPTQSSQAAAQAAETERLRQELLKKQAEAAEAEEDRRNAAFGLNVFGTVFGGLRPHY
jgi:peptidoglycan hydrolase-like protein with peptidoglycan-binding domain